MTKEYCLGILDDLKESVSEHIEDEKVRHNILEALDIAIDCVLLRPNYDITGNSEEDIWKE